MLTRAISIEATGNAEPREREWVITHESAKGTDCLEVVRRGRKRRIRKIFQWMANTEVLQRLAEIDRTLLEHNQSLQFLWRQIEPLIHPPDPPRPRVGFKP